MLSTVLILLKGDRPAEIGIDDFQAKSRVRQALLDDTAQKALRTSDRSLLP